MDGNRVQQSDEVVGEQMSVEQLRRLIRLLDGSDVSEIEVKHASRGTRLLLRKGRALEQSAAFIDQDDLDTSETGSESSGTESKYTVVAPLVGIFHPWAKPRGKALVAVGDKVKVGQIVATIQSLNVHNDVEATAAGRVVEILVQDGQAVEYGQPLMVIESSEEA